MVSITKLKKMHKKLIKGSSFSSPITHGFKILDPEISKEEAQKICYDCGCSPPLFNNIGVVTKVFSDHSEGVCIRKNKYHKIWKEYPDVLAPLKYIEKLSSND